MRKESTKAWHQTEQVKKNFECSLQTTDGLCDNRTFYESLKITTMFFTTTNLIMSDWF